MNSKLEGNNITSESEALGLVSQVRFSGLTPLGTELDNKVLKPLVLAKAKRNALEKPVLIIVVTDGVPVSLFFRYSPFISSFQHSDIIIIIELREEKIIIKLSK